MNPLQRWLFTKDDEGRFRREFDTVWAVYPRQVQRGKAVVAYIATRRKGADFPTLLLAARGYSLAREGEEATFTLHAGTFFGPNEGWKDFEGKGADNGQPKRSRKDGQWEPPMRSLQKSRLETAEEPTKDPSQTEKSPEDLLEKEGL